MEEIFHDPRSSLVTLQSFNGVTKKLLSCFRVLSTKSCYESKPCSLLFELDPNIDPEPSLLEGFAA